MNNDEQQQPKLADEEVWLRAYCAAMPYNNNNPEKSYADADVALDFFKFRFPNERT